MHLPPVPHWCCPLPHVLFSVGHLSSSDLQIKYKKVFLDSHTQGYCYMKCFLQHMPITTVIHIITSVFPFDTSSIITPKLISITVTHVYATPFVFTILRAIRFKVTKKSTGNTSSRTIVMVCTTLASCARRKYLHIIYNPFIAIFILFVKLKFTLFSFEYPQSSGCNLRLLWRYPGILPDHNRGHGTQCHKVLKVWIHTMNFFCRPPGRHYHPDMRPDQFLLHITCYPWPSSLPSCTFDYNLHWKQGARSLFAVSLWRLPFPASYPIQLRWHILWILHFHWEG